MVWSVQFFVNSLLLGVGLAMDAFSVSMANGLNEPSMGRRRMAAIAGVFAGFQALMPLLGWVCVHTVVQLFEGFAAFIPWIALLLLAYIGGKMLLEGLRGQDHGPRLRGGHRGGDLRYLHRGAVHRAHLRHQIGRQGLGAGRGHPDLHRRRDLPLRPLRPSARPRGGMCGV